MVPQKSGDLELPETRFTYFDPEDKKYVTLTAPGIPIRVEEALVRTTSATPFDDKNAGNEPSLTLSRNLTSEEALLTLDYQPKTQTVIGSEILRRPNFMAANLLAALGLSISCFILHRARRNRENPRYQFMAQSKVEAKAAAQAAKRAALAGEGDAFFREAKNSLCAALAARTGDNFQAASIDDIVSAMARLDVSENRIDDSREFLKTADAQRFGRRNTTELQAMVTQFESILKEL